MNQTEFNLRITLMLRDLDSLLESCCYNSISKNHSYILTEIDIHPTGNAHDRRLREIKMNSKKELINFDEATSLLFSIYSNLYDINMTVFHALKKRTIIEISYVLRSSLDIEHSSRKQEGEPMYHTRIIHPFYLQNETEKFDVNWQHQEWKNWWKRFLMKRKLNNPPIR